MRMTLSSSHKTVKNDVVKQPQNCENDVVKQPQHCICNTQISILLLCFLYLFVELAVYEE